jgi:ketopantoate reductase
MDFVGGFIIGAIVGGGIGIYVGACLCYLGAKVLGWVREATTKVTWRE